MICMRVLYQIQGSDREVLHSDRIWRRTVRVAETWQKWKGMVTLYNLLYIIIVIIIISFSSFAALRLFLASVAQLFDPVARGDVGSMGHASTLRF